MSTGCTCGVVGGMVGGNPRGTSADRSVLRVRNSRIGSIVLGYVYCMTFINCSDEFAGVVLKVRFELGVLVGGGLSLCLCA